MNFQYLWRKNLEVFLIFVRAIAKENRDIFVGHSVNPQGQVHPLVLNIRPSIVTWKVSGGVWPQKEFWKGLQSLSQVPEDQARNLITNRPGVNGLAGVVNAELIRIHAI